MHVVVRPFAYAPDGIHPINMTPGDELDFGDATAGLLAEGWIADMPSSVPSDTSVSENGQQGAASPAGEVGVVTHSVSSPIADEVVVASAKSKKR